MNSETKFNNIISTIDKAIEDSFTRSAIAVKKSKKYSRKDLEDALYKMSQDPRYNGCTVCGLVIAQMTEKAFDLIDAKQEGL